MSKEQELRDLEKQFPALRQEFETSRQAYHQLPQDPTRVTQRRQALQRWHGAGTALFDAYEKMIALAEQSAESIRETWYTGKASVVSDLLDTLESHYRIILTEAEKLHLPRDSFKPSRMAYVNLQRLVKETDPAYANDLRVRLNTLGLATPGLDDAGRLIPTTQGIEPRFFVVGIILLLSAVGMAFWGFGTRDLSQDQRWILRWLFPLASGFGAGAFTGSISAKGRRLTYGLLVTATGGFAVWLLTYLILTYGNPPHDPKDNENGKKSAAEETLVKKVEPGAVENPGKLELTDMHITDDRRGRSHVTFPVVDVKLRNPGKEVVFLTQATISVKKVWRLAPMGEYNDEARPSAEYTISIKLKGAPSVATKSISQSIKPNSVDRFLLTIDSPDAESYWNHLVVAELALNYNKTHRLDCGTLRFIIDSSWNAPYENNHRWEKDEIKKHLDKLFLIRHALELSSKYGGVTTPKLVDLIERVNKSPPTPASWKPPASWARDNSKLEDGR
jgi:hypothetical protein